MKRSLPCKPGCNIATPCPVCRKRAAGRAWSAANPEKHRKYHQKYRADPVLTKIRRHRERGIVDPERQSELELQQDGTCAICRRKMPLVLDHDHQTGLVRGLLCQPCNLGLGQLKDSPELLGAAI
jgi:hypothetical protein